MTNESKDPAESAPLKTMPPTTTRWKSLRIWPALLLLTGMVFFRFLPQMIEDGPPSIWMSAAFGPALCGLMMIGWWLVLSRATWRERLAGFFGILIAAGTTLAAIDKSMMGPAVTVLTIPMGTAAFAIGAICCSQILTFKRTAIALLFSCLGFGFSTLVRTDGMWGNFAIGLHWRWVVSQEDKLVEKASSRKADPVEPPDMAIASALSKAEWAGFRGPDRDGKQRGSKISADWKNDPPKLIWKIPVGPSWSSFAVAGSWIFTQEQRGSMETVVCYEADSGKEVWTQQVESRFDDPLGGPGPRSTPTIADGGVFVTFATGFLMKLDPSTGQVLWRQDIREVAGRKPPMWGFSSSPLVVESVVIVYAGGAGDKGILAFNTGTGKLDWSAKTGDDSYGSPQLSKLLDEQLVLILTNDGLNIFNPATGAERLNYEWKFEGYRALQPQVVDTESILIPTGMGAGTRRIRVSKTEKGLTAAEEWTTRNLKPDFNDFVVFQGHAYGFDGAIFTSIDLKNGQRNWKGGRYGKGQVLLLNDSGLLIVVSEQGQIVLVKADPAAHLELATFQAIEGKTWNHPVVIEDRLYVRNAEEAACFRLPLEIKRTSNDSGEAEKTFR